MRASSSPTSSSPEELLGLSPPGSGSREQPPANGGREDAPESELMDALHAGALQKVASKAKADARGLLLAQAAIGRLAGRLLCLTSARQVIQDVPILHYILILRVLSPVGGRRHRVTKQKRPMEGRVPGPQGSLGPSLYGVHRNSAEPY